MVDHGLLCAGGGTARSEGTRTIRRVTSVIALLSMLIAAAPVGVRADTNHPPVAVDDPGPACGSFGAFGGAFPIPEDWHDWFLLGLGCGPLANDTDADGDPLSIELVGEPSHGEAKVITGAPDWIAYRPDPDYSTAAGDWVSDVITYRAFDGQAYSAPASYRLWIAPVNDPPTFTAGPALISVHAGDGPVSIPWATAISAGPPNESGQAVTFEISNPDAAKFAVPPAIDADGNLTFTPGISPWLATMTVDARDNGGLDNYGLPASDPFDRADDTSDPVTLQIAIYPSPPIAVDDSFSLDEDTSDYVDLTGNDINRGNGTLTITGFSVPAKGTVEKVLGAHWGVLYTPYPDANGSDAFTYTIEDGDGNTDVGTVSVTILPVPDAPVAADDSITVGFDSGATSVPVLGNDTDVDGDALSVIAVGGAAHGTVSMIDGLPAYVPDAGFSGMDAFDYTVSDPGGLEASATVHVTVSADGTPPVVDTIATTLTGGRIDGRRVPLRIWWHASDIGTGVAATELQEQVGGRSWQAVPLAGSQLTSTGRTIAAGESVGYRARAIDGAGNVGSFTAVSARATLRGDASPTVHLGGTWIRLRDPRYTDGHARVAHHAGCTASLTFAGREIAWVGQLGPALGRAEVRIDGKLVATVNLHATTTRRRRIVFRAAVAGGGTHVLQIGSLNDRSVVIDGFIVLR